MLTVSENKVCSKNNCNRIGTRIYCKRRNKIYKYCDIHYRFSLMSDSCRQRYKQKISINDIEKMYKKIFGLTNNPLCPSCNKNMIWHTNYGSRNDLITIQHWDKNNIGFLCGCCNTRHGASSNKNILNINTHHKWCACCKTVKDKLDFSKNKSNKNGLSDRCKNCCKKDSKIQTFNKQQKRKNIVIGQCLYCNNNMVDVRSNKKYCSKKCYWKYRYIQRCKKKNNKQEAVR